MARKHGRGQPGDQPTASDRANDLVRLHAMRVQLLGYFQSGCALPGHQVVVVIRWHQRCAGFFSDVPGDFGPVTRLSVIGDNLGPPLGGVVQLYAGRIGGHHDFCRNPHRAGRCGDTLRVVAGGIGHDPRLALSFVQRRNLVVGPANFERAGLLQAFRFDQQPEPKRVVQQRRFQQRGSDHDIP